jgi:hypothetical protein
MSFGGRTRLPTWVDRMRAILWGMAATLPAVVLARW